MTSTPLLSLLTERNEYIRALQVAGGTKIESTEDWVSMTDDLIRLAFHWVRTFHSSITHAKSRATLKRQFPDSPLIGELDYGFVYAFARPALNAQWRLLVDSCGQAPKPTKFDEQLYVDAYIPTSYTAVPFTVVNLEDPHADPDVRWLVPGPRGGWIEVDDSSSSAYVTASEGGLPSDVSPRSTKSVAADTSSDSSSVWSSDPQQSPERAAGAPTTPCTPATRAIKTLRSLGSPSPKT